jgi:hypothetical protein
LLLNPSQGKDGLGKINGLSVYDPRNPALSSPGSLTSNQRCPIVIGVLVKEGQAEIQVDTNQRRIISWKGPVDQLDVEDYWAPPHHDRIGVAVTSEPAMFHSVRLVYSKSTPPGTSATPQ